MRNCSFLSLKKTFEKQRIYNTAIVREAYLSINVLKHCSFIIIYSIMYTFVLFDMSILQSFFDPAFKAIS